MSDRDDIEALETEIEVAASTIGRLVGERDEARAEADRLRAENRRLREALAEVQWGECGDLCPVCDRWEHEGHAPDCRLAAALAGGPPPAEGGGL